MLKLSVRTTESIKTGLAIVIAYAIALELGWEKPFWAAFAVAFVSLDTSGASLNKGTMRMMGSFLAGAVALSLIALFPQDRWAMIFFLSLYVGFCTYMVAGKRAKYFWFVSAFVAIVIIVDSAPSDSVRAFQIAVARLEETGMGILVYSLISTFLWPRSSRSDLEAASQRLASLQHQLFRRYLELMLGKGSADDSQQLRLQEVKLVTQIGQLLNGAESDSYTVWELRRQWRQFREQTTALGVALERWRESFPEVQHLEATRYLPNLDELCAELDLRFAEIERVLTGETPSLEAQAVTLRVDRPAVRQLPHFERAALALTKTQLDRLESLSRAILDTVRDIRGHPIAAEPVTLAARHESAFGIDVDRLRSAIAVMATLWTAFFVRVYVDPPGGGLFVFMPTQWVLLTALAPSRVISLVPSFVIGIGLGGVIYIFVMPHLVGYAELGLMLFAVTFVVFYICWKPQRRPLRSSLLAQVYIFIGIENQQSYDFASFANTSLTILLSLALAIATTTLLMPQRPEKIYMSLFKRFFRHAEFLLARMSLDWEREKGVSGRWKTLLYRDDLMEIPEKLASLGPRIDYRTLPGTTPEQVQALTLTLQALAYRIHELLDARERPQAEFLVQELLADLRAWRLAVQEQMQLWARNPDAAARQDIDIVKRVEDRFAKLEARVEETFGKVGEGALELEDYDNFYRLLGGFRGLSEAGMNFVQVASGINWARWREARF